MPKLLQVWSFEERLSNKDKEDLLKYFGADSVQHIPRRGRDVAVLASFRREEDCEYALKKLHQQEVLGKRLMAVYKESSSKPSKQPHQATSESIKVQEPSREEIIRKKIKEYESRIVSISSTFNIRHPIPPHLKYLYPPPSATTMANIVQALISVPKFYTQVLHLMNKMNLPAPFESLRILPHQYLEVLKLLGLYSEVDSLNPNVEQVSISDNEEEMQVSEKDVSESESELESDIDESIKHQKITKQIKRRIKPSKIMSKRPNFALLKNTCVPHPRLVGSSISEAFESKDSLQSRKLELKLKGKLPSETEISSVSDNLEVGGFGKMEAVKHLKEKSVQDNPVEWKGESAKYISKEELQNDRINKADWAILPVFKNYKLGEPSSKLYIKNLAKTTSEADLKFIYGNYVFWHNEEEASKFTIRLMKEGRMKGQAFVTFPSVEAATEALSDTNGYILNDKPMVVAFGKVKAT
ncbi:RNA-binding region-containing protein 3-like [Palaemon carinicauda]|uniref:RNA-binding region-containing protein 3-like n=1 Tax=Palaemon carinicauda TaxID=392227 RepID=UPI0035B637EB